MSIPIEKYFNERATSLCYSLFSGTNQIYLLWNEFIRNIFPILDTEVLKIWKKTSLIIERMYKFSLTKCIMTFSVTFQYDNFTFYFLWHHIKI